MSIIVDFRAKIAKFGYRIVYLIPIFALFQRRFSRGGATAILPPKSSVQTALSSGRLPPSKGGCQWRDPALTRTHGNMQPFLYILISRARASSLLRSSRAKKCRPEGRRTDRISLCAKVLFVGVRAVSLALFHPLDVADVRPIQLEVEDVGVLRHARPMRALGQRQHPLRQRELDAHLRDRLAVLVPART